MILAVLALGGARLRTAAVARRAGAAGAAATTCTRRPPGVAWVFTSYLLAASVVTPIAGRLGDMFGKKRVLVVTLAGLAAGSLLAALVHTLPLMIVARTIQGLGGAIFPLAFGIVRDEFPRERVAGAIALISGILGIGGGLGIVLAGPILRTSPTTGSSGSRWSSRSISALAAIVFIPESPLRAPGNVHWLGAILLSGWLVALLLAVSEAPTWGWGSSEDDRPARRSAAVSPARGSWRRSRRAIRSSTCSMMRLPGSGRRTWRRC